MNDDDIQRILGALPEHQASENFTSRVLEQLDLRPESRTFRRLAAAALLVLVLAGGGMWARAVDERREEQRLQALRAERDAIRRELEELKRLTSGYEDPVIEIQRKEGVDLVIDMSEQQNGVRPAKQIIPPI